MLEHLNYQYFFLPYMSCPVGITDVSVIIGYSLFRHDRITGVGFGFGSEGFMWY